MWFVYVLYIFPIFLFNSNNFSLKYFNKPFNTFYFMSAIVIFGFLAVKIYYFIKYKKINNDYLFFLINSFLLNILFWFSLFKIKSFLLLIICFTTIFINSSLLYIESNKISKKYSYLIIPYLIYIFINIIIFINLS